ncbi:hypothetical protein [Neotabrizicola sp. VNH66]|uniref:hypothetical protein n=1 Tax=Neotabrizicola sp. VNH66 TaxID=3400918 RepID=UPI003BFBF78F
MEQQIPTQESTGADLVSLVLSEDWSLSIYASPVAVIAILIVVFLVWLVMRIYFRQRLTDFQIDSAEFGLGDQKISLRLNDTDRQIAYSIWVELSTRKIGLPIDIEDDVISEIYDSWFAFFSVTRELIKDIPVSKVRTDSTSKIINLSVEVLNEGLRPHLTKWQARYRHWYERQLDKADDVDPQGLQKRFPAYEALKADMLEVNQRLIRYRHKMNELVTK